MYVYLNKKRSIKFIFPIVPTADQENVLEIFLSTNYNIEQALDKLRLPITNKNYCKKELIFFIFFEILFF